MHILMDNAEVRPQRASCTPPDALEGACQLFGIPFRHDKRSGVFAADPPLLGKRVVIKSFKVDRQAEGNLHGQLAAELRLLERLLWVSGADVTLEESLLPESRSVRPREPAYWDLALFVFPGQAVPGRIEPLAIHSWWHGSFKSWRLAGHLAIGGDASGYGLKRVTTLRMAGELKKWFSRALFETAAPAVLLSIPMVDGYVEPLLDTLSLTICQSVLAYFRKPLLAPLTREVLKQSGGAEERALAALETQARQARTVLAVSAESGEPPVLRPPTADHAEPAASKQQAAIASGEIVAPRSPAGVSEPLTQAALPEEQKSVDEAVSADQKPVQSPQTQRRSVQGLSQRRDSFSQPAQQAYPRPAPTQQPSGEATGPGPLPSATLGSKDDRPAQQAAASQKQPQPVGRGTDEQLERLRLMLIESPELAAKRAVETLVSKGIKPTKEMVEEYLNYLGRMLFKPDDKGSEADSR